LALRATGSLALRATVFSFVIRFARMTATKSYPEATRSAQPLA
jgi:hypothetical protein